MSNPFQDQPNNNNPYAAPQMPQGMPGYGQPGMGGDPYMAQQKVSGPATAIFVTAILSIVSCVISIPSNIFTLTMMGSAANVPPEVATQLTVQAGIGIVAGIIGLLCSIFILKGANQMKKLENYSGSRTAVILAMIPCVSPCCILGLPFGIWALNVLGDPNVKSSFRS
jgi:hypothetical protein